MNTLPKYAEYALLAFFTLASALLIGAGLMAIVSGLMHLTGWLFG